MTSYQYDILDGIGSLWRDALTELNIYHAVGSQKSLAQQVTDELQRLMLTGKLREGEKLPSERELCELFGVSRTVVRESIRILQTKGLLEVKPGIGSIVRSPSSSQVIEGLSLLIQSKANGADISLDAVCEVRSLLEVQIARMAAERATREDIEEIQRIIDDLESRVNLPAKFYERAVDFHRSLALATHNPLLVILFDAIQELVLGMRQTLVPEPIAPQAALRSFEQALEQVQAQNPEGAAQVIERHLYEIRQKFEAALFRLEGKYDGVVISQEVQV
jgi:GntR family transcriptional repressor for pyruvate dehydrogenase complex